MEIYLLDMGQKKYGDSILITRNNRSILIDGGHPEDSEIITNQLKKVFKKNPPFNIDLLIITHCHSDHIGCLPQLISNDIIRPKSALLADAKLGWGRTSDGIGPSDGFNINQKKLFYALLEEDRSDFEDIELEDFIQDTLNLEDKYLQMIETLGNNDVQVVFYGRDDHASIEESFVDFGLKLLGPTAEHLSLCAEAISRAGDEMGADTLDQIDDAMDDMILVNKYRQINRVKGQDAFLGKDMPGVGAAKNNQSIVLSVHADGWNALLAGDMQLAKAEVRGLNEEMLELRQTIVNEGPYDFVKLTHHTSYNGFNGDVLGDYPETKLFAHTGGKKDSKHPEESALMVLKANRDRLDFARTDRNGLITVKKQNNSLVLVPSKGRLNNFTVNQVGDEELEIIEIAEKKQTEPVIQTEEAFDKVKYIEVITKVPEGIGKVLISIEIEPSNRITDTISKKKSNSFASSALLIGDGRRLPKLLFVTSSARLTHNIGQLETERIVDSIQQSNSHEILDIPLAISNIEGVSDLVRDKTAKGSYKGVVILGGYDVIPAARVDTIDLALRNKLEKLGDDEQDADDFIVWSDDVYGDLDNDLFPELPVSRIPDARDPEVIYGALQTKDFNRNSSFGIRNIARPFADIVFSRMPGSDPSNFNISESYNPTRIRNNQAIGAVYYMLHGLDNDGTTYWGETQDGDAYEAINLAGIPGSASGTIVFTGCCWGALPVFNRASRVLDSSILIPKSAEQSIALKYLKAGVQAFVGCTGSHYSPLEAPYDFYGKPMHDYFWSQISKGLPPAKALLEAKKQYGLRIPHNKRDSFSKAIELKILNQFTCLGLGW